jgi:hypothetical protein
VDGYFTNSERTEAAGGELQIEGGRFALQRLDSRAVNPAPGERRTVCGLAVTLPRSSIRRTPKYTKLQLELGFETLALRL